MINMQYSGGKKKKKKEKLNTVRARRNMVEPLQNEELMQLIRTRIQNQTSTGSNDASQPIVTVRVVTRGPTGTSFSVYI